VEAGTVSQMCIIYVERSIWEVTGSPIITAKQCDGFEDRQPVFIDT
jgi:hypothetical protein